MTFVEAITSCFRKYFVYDGRAPLSEFWFWTLFEVIVFTVAIEADLFIFGDDGCESGWLWNCSFKHHAFENILDLAFLIPGIMVSIRRMHDVNRSGWWLLSILPAIYWFFVKGTPGENRFGPDPLARGPA